MNKQTKKDFIAKTLYVQNLIDKCAAAVYEVAKQANTPEKQDEVQYLYLSAVVTVFRDIEKGQDIQGYFGNMQIPLMTFSTEKRVEDIVVKEHKAYRSVQLMRDEGGKIVGFGPAHWNVNVE